MIRRKINVRTPVAAAWLGTTADFAALTAKRSRATLSLPANAGMRNVLARLIEQSDHDKSHSEVVETLHRAVLLQLKPIHQGMSAG